MLRSLLHHRHLGSNLNPTKRRMTSPIATLDINRVQIILLVMVLTKELRLKTRRAGSARPVRRGSVAGILVVAVCRKQLREDATEDWAQEGETGADDGDVAFGCCPVCGIHIAIYGLVSLGLVRSEEVEDLQDVSALFATVRKLESRRILVITTLYITH